MKKFINGMWVADNLNEPAPEQLSGTLSATATISGTTLNLTDYTTTDSVDWSGTSISGTTTCWPYYDGYPYYWIPNYGWSYHSCEQPAYQALSWNGTTILYRFLTNCIEYAIIEAGESIKFATADKLEEILTLLRD